MLGTSGRRLVDDHDLVMLDLDGVVYVGEDAVPGAAAHLARVRELGGHVAYVTNNASRPPEQVAAKLSGLGVPADRADVVTSAQAAARLLLDRHGEDAAISVLGARGLQEAVAEVGLRPTGVADRDAVGIVSGFDPDVLWREVMLAATRIRGGLPWVASNRDLTFPTSSGTAPGHGALVDLLARFAGVEPLVAGKPEPPLLAETIRRVGGRRPLMVGDRLDTDIEGGRRADVETLVVLTGVTGLGELVAAGPSLRPTYLALDLGGLLERHRAPERTSAGWELAGWRARTSDGRLAVTGAGELVDWWRVAVSAAWEHLDALGRPADTTDLVTPVPPSGR